MAHEPALAVSSSPPHRPSRDRLAKASRAAYGELAHRAPVVVY
jgi:hypothetical protein